MDKKSVYTVLIILISIIYYYVIDKGMNYFKYQTNDVPVSYLNNENVSQVTKVKIVLLREPEEGDKLKDIRGCDSLFIKEIDVNRNINKLNSTLIELFNTNKTYINDITGHNVFDFISTQRDLKYRNVIVKNNDVKVYLTGKIGPLGGSCDNVRIKTQIEETIRQFPGIDSIQIYLNDELNDFNFSEK